MEKKQTALNELLEWVMEFEDKPVKPTLTNMKEKIWQLLPKEREQIINAAAGHCYPTAQMEMNDAERYYEQYYTQTYKP